MIDLTKLALKVTAATLESRIRSPEDQTNSYYRENPEKLFYKEQCYLLSYISQIAGHKKNNIDSVGFYAVNTYTGLVTTGPRGTDPVREAFFAGNFDDIGVSTKRTPYTTSLLAKNTKKQLKWNGNASILLDGDPYAFINKLAISKNLGPLINIENDILSYLQPYVRLYKVIYDKNGEEREVEITFEPTFNEFEKNLFNSRRVRNTGVGLKNFSFTYDGSNPFGAKKSIKANLHIFSNSFDELMICRGSGKCDDIDDAGFVSSYRYVDLALKTFNNNNKNIKFGSVYRENDELAKLNFRLKAQVGYSMPSNFGRITGNQKRELQKALRDSRVTLNLIPTVHDFQFDELGRVNFSINYLAFVEDLFSQAKFNVFSEKYASRDRIVRNASLKYYQKTCEADAVRTIKEEYAERATEEISNSISNLITLMMERDKISYVEISMDQIKDYISFGPFSEKNINSKIKISSDKGYLERMKKNINECLELFKERRASIDTDDQQKITASLATIDSSVEILSFFYVSDLIDIVLENIETELDQMPDLLREYKNNNITSVAAQSDEIDEKIDEYQKNTKAFQKTRYLLGPVEFVSPNDNQSFFVNLGDIPISLKYFFEWLTSTMLDRDDSFYSLSRFMNEFFNDFIQKFLNNDRCFDYSIKQRTKLNQATLLGTKAQNSNLDKITNLMIEKRNPRLNIDDGEVKSSLPLIHSYGLASNSENSRITASDEINYMTYFVGRTMPTERMRGIRSEDEELGVFHYQIGRDRGLVKNIELTKTQTPGLQEVRFEQQGYDGLEQLRVVYDAKIECFSNVNTFPGTYIYIDPAGYAPRSHPTQIDLTKYGVGGYYMIVRSTHTFGPGIANSDIEAKWVNELYDPDKPQPQYIKETTSTEDPKNLKCTAHVERETKAKEK
jgi:hypothetical protein